MSPEIKPAEDAQAAATTATPAEKSLLDSIVEEGRLGQTAEERVKGKEWLVSLVEQVMRGQMTVSKDAEKMLNERLRDLDEKISTQLNEVMHAPEFQKLEGAWRGLNYFVDQTETSTMLKIKLFNVSKTDLLKDLTKGSEFDQSQLFKKIYEEEYGTFGGHPFGVLIGDYEFGAPSAGHGHCSKRCRTSPRRRTLRSSPPPARSSSTWESFTELGGPRDLAKIFDTEATSSGTIVPEESTTPRYVGLALPHILMRLPYGQDTEPVEEFDYVEDVDGKDHSKYLWGNAAYALGARITNAFARTSGAPPFAASKAAGSSKACRCTPSDRRRRHRSEMPDRNRHHRPARERAEQAGLHPLVLLQEHAERGVLRRADGATSRSSTTTTTRNANARLSAQLPYILAASRFAHLPQSHDARQDRQLHDPRGVPGVSQQVDRRLRAAGRHGRSGVKAQVIRCARRGSTSPRSPGKPGAYKAVAFLRPHFQLEELTISMRLVAQLPKPKG